MRAWMFVMAIAAILMLALPAMAQTYDEAGDYIEGTNVSVDTTNAFNRSFADKQTAIPIWFQIDNTLNVSATDFNIATEYPSLLNSTQTANNGDWFWVNVK